MARVHKKLAPECTFFPPTAPERIARVEAALGVALPGELKSLLAESNGILGETGYHLIRSVERIEKNNLSFRNEPHFAELYMPFTPLLFFADAGNGDGWNHENDSRTWVAPSLERYIAGALQRTLRF